MIGVLALQGGFIEHIHALNQLGADNFEIRKKEDLTNKDITGLILPGGESTVMGKLLHETGLWQPLKYLIDNGTPVFGTCAGLILLAKKMENDANVYFDAIDISVQRNAFGRQLGSFNTNEHFADIGLVPMTFIRAPYINRAAPNVDILAHTQGHIVAAKHRNILVTAFHPELTEDLRVHEYFLKNFN
ncbi:MAG: pyridoxal 5'-phosphate synthase glutaminase subunit PdxT [Clostridia bacterium]|jgi:5'-phosphate synthase pdxT subunit|nr:pyridoxal 5'-phosphate synthase glutaminase subunit PdxT [Clostridia bacterium]